MVVRTPAKINLALLVGPRRSDGYHELASVYQAVSLYDEVTATSLPAGEISISVSGLGAEHVPVTEDNLAVRAASLLAEECAIDEGVALTIRKSIPVAGGMAGGSSDAAAALVACDALWGTELDREEMLAVAARLGSDVPFCVVGGTAVGSGHGELVTPALARGTYAWVLAFDPEGLSTPAVFSEFDRMLDDPELTASPTVPSDLMAALLAGNPVALGQALTNDLQPAALRLRPRLRRVLDFGTEHGALGSLVSGSGPTCVFLARDNDHAVDLAVTLSSSGLVSSVKPVSGPVPGARVI
ncbi:4-(cytidine 5'-diphospho)-2-C-methyl-D-erythritol kinase [Tenggerimyces flavus]|uniref:4-diphosphocytidyl-2-C-methyl-D-erythritol kinase n=1 Tax=Tenggerimyces flavus TaxID=1708749 RepID=A0ABV7YAP3_9ACTN|nr:4-(cytidine 5'-diphospho)-2-C-methyl-D-erythritol kinase [Tenggerimyces flavus]